MKTVFILGTHMIIACVLVPSATGNGRLLVPPQRSSLWREPQFYNNYDVYRNYDDHTLDCGGYWIWMGNDNLDPLAYGWQCVDGKYSPIKTLLPPAPDELLKIVRCNCKANCDSKKCSCRKHGIECSGACGDCKGVSCSNSFNLADLEEDSDDV